MGRQGLGGMAHRSIARKMTFSIVREAGHPHAVRASLS